MEDERQGDPVPLPETAPPVPPRRRVIDRLDGSRLGNKVQLAAALLKAGASITKTAKDLGISRHSVQAVARRMTRETVATPQRVEQEFDNYVKGDMRRIAKMSLNAITEEKIEGASVRDLAYVADKSLERLQAMDGQGNNVGFYLTLIQNYGLLLSHSVSKVTTEPMALQVAPIAPAPALPATPTDPVAAQRALTNDPAED